MNHTLKRTAIAAPILVSSMFVFQVAAAVPPPADTPSGDTTPAQHAKKKVKHETKKATEETKNAPHKAHTKAKKEKEKEKEETNKGKVKDKVEGATEEAHEAAGKANADIVGAETQAENERKAREQKEREAKEDAEAKRAGEKVGRATTTAASAVVGAAQDVTRATELPGQYSPVVVSWNPLGAIVGGRVSFNVEYAPVTHHVIILSPHFANPSQDVLVAPGETHTNRFTGVGTELGYRYYTGTRGPSGVFIGPSLIGGIYNADLMKQNTAFTNIGVAMDIGFQTIVWDHLALAAGAGVEYLHVSKDFGDLSDSPSTIASSGIKPRLLGQAGYAF